jgi:hypothetical protein
MPATTVEQKEQQDRPTAAQEITGTAGKAINSRILELVEIPIEE